MTCHQNKQKQWYASRPAHVYTHPLYFLHTRTSPVPLTCRYPFLEDTCDPYCKKHVILSPLSLNTVAQNLTRNHYWIRERVYSASCLFAMNYLSLPGCTTKQDNKAVRRLFFGYLNSYNITDRALRLAWGTCPPSGEPDTYTQYPYIRYQTFCVL